MTGFLPRSPSLTPDVAAALVSPLRESAPPVSLPLALAEIDSAETFLAVSSPASDLVLNGRFLKFLIDRRVSSSPVVHFVNGNFLSGGVTPDAARYHYFFARETLGIPESLEEFNALTYFTEDKRYVAGVVHTYLLTGASEPVFGIQFYPRT